MRRCGPGDTITYSTRIAEKIDLASRPNWGLLVSRNEGENQNGETVITFMGELFVERRAPWTPAADRDEDQR